MPLQNRVDPFGEIHAVAERGMFTGNRGVIHDPASRTLLKRRWTTKAWLICDCGFEGRRRAVMGRNAPGGGAGWTNLFFLDEVTALAAGHRPCYLCRREKAKEFADCVGRGLGIATPSAGEIDERLHVERLASGGLSTEHKANDVDYAMFMALPDGAMLFQGDRPFAKWRGELRAWTFRGWVDAWDFNELGMNDVWLLTPPSTVAALAAGYRPVWHPSIQNRA